MKILKWFLIVLVILVLIAAGFLGYLGLLSEPKVSEMKTGPYTLVYEDFVGPYSQTGPIIARVYQAVKAAGFETLNGLGLYFDDPRKVAANQLRSQVGVVIENKDLAKFAKVSRKFKVKKIPQTDSIVVEFPIRNNLSYMLGPIKGYPALTSWAKAKGYKMARPFEFYDLPGKKILFIMEIVK